MIWRTSLVAASCWRVPISSCLGFPFNLLEPTRLGARLPVVDVLRLVGGRGTDLLRFAIEVRSSSETTSH